MATKQHKAIADPDALYLIDADLAILGEAPSTYRDYQEKSDKNMPYTLIFFTSVAGRRY